MPRLWIVSFVMMAIGGLAFHARSAAPISVQPSSPNTATMPQDAKVMREFRGVKLGLKSDAVRTALGKPESASEEREEYKLSDDDTLTVHYDSGAVKAIQIRFTSAKNAPSWKDVVGNTEIQQNENGSKFARVVVTADSFWVSMYQSKDGTITSITISR